MKNPKLISKPFAQNGQKNVIPEKYETSMEGNQATWDQGFGQITMLPVSAGGLPPKGQDFNGILNQMCETIVHISKGGIFKFSADYAAAINGYPKGAILQSEDEKKYYQSLVDNNKINFNTASQDQIKTSWKLVMTDDLLDQLSKKLESSAVVQSTGTSTTSVMSQKASTDTFQPKGNYPTIPEMNSELNKKIDKASISQQLANDVNKVPSLDLVTKELGNKQPKGNYADKSSTAYQVFNGPIDATNNVGAKAGERRIQFELTAGKPEITHTDGVNGWRGVVLPDKTGTLALIGDSYTKAESNNIYQPKGSYQPAGNYALAGESYTTTESDGKYQPKGNYADKSSTAYQVFNGPIDATNNVGAKAGERRIQFELTAGKPEITHTDGVNGWRGVVLPDKTGTLALIGDSYTKAESNNIYQPKGNYSLLSQVMGIGQSYSDVTEGREINTVYKNTSGKGMVININGRTVGNAISTFLVNDKSAMTISGSDVYAINRNISVVIPEGASYELRSSNFTFVSWAELV
ncbi:hypothetical protein [Proteus sp. fly-1008]|uniref:hypothetical protein n=1 Tax=Proteus sp. fly-1008 TaxID=3136672 RepID=UPI0032DB33DA